MAAVVAAPLGSCGLIDSDVTDFPLRLPEKEFNVDTAEWMLSVPGGGNTFPTLDCPPLDCAQAVSQVCAGDSCGATCDGNAHCQAQVNVSVFQMFNLSTESPELETIDSQAVVTVTVENISFKVKENTLNVASPPLEVYLAPQGVNDPASTMAVEIGTIASVPPGQTGEGQIDLTPTGKMAMESYMSNWRTPFNVIVAGEVAISAGDPVPMGRLSGSVTVLAHAGL
jgi:hypothetical protein